MVSRPTDPTTKLTISRSPEPECRGKLWRSEIEVIPEIEGTAIGKSISERQQARMPCHCNAESFLKNQ
jgi:hypothetical protein